MKILKFGGTGSLIVLNAISLLILQWPGFQNLYPSRNMSSVFQSMSRYSFS